MTLLIMQSSFRLAAQRRPGDGGLRPSMYPSVSGRNFARAGRFFFSRDFRPIASSLVLD